ncbi:pleckstrin homology domain-containing family O member 1b isoform X1 [Megalops cyprinoides]|uniref:pleckstrin homology domain-containing family O member 1b isoform X1 n=2 Tax=Megalops cyprinoides TaxID=118141 RepID=UPI0018655206|nr:pleckstrin homology domain-containing family O member 1b isoform X1 [Megalops cyprinoides]
MKKNNSAKRGPQDANQPSAQPDKIGWIRKFCGKGIFREIWKNRFVVLKGDQLYISEKEVKDEKKIQEVFDLTDYERSEELRKSKSRSKKNHSKFTLLRSRQPGNTVPNLVFLAVSPEEKESWINALNGAITRAKNRILDEVTVEEESLLVHPTRDRAKIPHTRRLPTRGHLMAVASTSTSDGMLTLDLIQEEDASSPEEQDTCEKNFRVDLDKSVAQLASGGQQSDPDGTQTPATSETVLKAGSLPRKSEISWDRQHQEGQARTPQPGKKLTAAEKSRCASMEEILSHSDTRATKRAIPASPSAPVQPISQLQDLISQKLERTQELLTEVRLQERKGKDSPHHKGSDSESARAEAERLLQEAACNWGQARDVLEEVKELRALYRQLDSAPATPLTPSQSGKLKSPQQTQYRKSMM